MISIGDFVQDLLNPDLAFLPKALLVAVMSSVAPAPLFTVPIFQMPFPSE